MFDGSEPARVLVELNCGGTVMAAVGAVEKVPAGVDFQFGAGAGSAEAGGQCGDGLKGREGTVSGIPRQRDNRAGDFIDQVNPAAVGVKPHMPRTRTGRDRDEGRIVEGELARGLVEAIDVEFVDAEIGDENEPIGGIDHDGVCVGGGLTTGMQAVAGMLIKLRPVANGAVRSERERGDTAAVIVRDQHETAGAVEADEARVAAAGEDAVKQPQVTGVRFDGVGGEAAGRTGVARVKVTSIRREDEEGRFLRGEEKFRWREGPGFGVDMGERKADAGPGAMGTGIDERVGTEGGTVQPGNKPDQKKETERFHEKRGWLNRTAAPLPSRPARSGRMAIVGCVTAPDFLR